MEKQKRLEELEDYFEDIRRWIEQEDYSSAQKMVSALRKAIVIWKKQKK